MSPTNKWALVAVVVSGLVGAVFGWLRERDERMRWEGRTEVAEELAEARRDSIHELEDRVSDALAAAETARTRAELVSVAADSVRAEALVMVRRDRSTFVDSVVAAQEARDTTVAREVASVVAAGYEAELRRAGEALEESEAQVMELREALGAAWALAEAREEEAAGLRALNAALEDMAAGRDRARTGFLERTAERALWVAGGVALGAIGWELAR